LLAHGGSSFRIHNDQPIMRKQIFLHKFTANEVRKPIKANRFVTSTDESENSGAVISFGKQGT
jgi:hypothetical protein